MSETTNPPRKSGVNLLRNWFLIAVVVIVLLTVGTSFLGTSLRQPTWTLTQVAAAAQEGKIARVDVDRNDGMTITLKDGSVVYSTKDASATAPEQLAELGVSDKQLRAIVWNSGGVSLVTLLGNLALTILPLLVIGYFAFRLFRQTANYESKG